MVWASSERETHWCSSSGKIVTGQQDVSQVTPELILPHSMGPPYRLSGKALDLIPGIEAGVALLTAHSLRSFVYTGEKQNSERSLRRVQPHSHTQAHAHTVGIHTDNTQLGMESYR